MCTRDRRPDPTVSVVPSPRFVLFVFSSFLVVPEFCPSRQASPLTASPHARRSRLSHPAVRGSLRRRSRLSHPVVRGSLRRRSRLSHPAVRGSSRRHPRLTLAHRPAAESMPAGLPLTQARRIAADSSPPDCR